MSLFKSPTSMAVLVAFFYILITWSLYVQWESSVEAFYQASNALKTNEFETSMNNIAVLADGVPQQSGLLKVLLLPIPSIVAAAAGDGLIKFWSVLLQGLLLGGVTYLSVKAWLIKQRTRP